MKKISAALAEKLHTSRGSYLKKRRFLEEIDLHPEDFDRNPVVGEVIILKNSYRELRFPRQILGAWSVTGQNLDGTYRLQRYR